MENIMEPEAEDPGITIAVLRDSLAKKTAEVENLKERIAKIEQIAVLAKTFSFDVQTLLGNFRETPQEIAGAAEIEAEMFPEN
ncbi:hypothetical protein DAPPUDRAFT_334130 [Daphnia pulex]|uniref:Uncharacterized protein n=1 Tax=Daphnia pulex TaxID=6669 RepID=E9HUT2_DAPPU|nr:hypothetical protein DAPPUDRAFT_334130 [Daphnia pulex]|eukprot:EFX64505.1 hypothetical protein DAPPUDRAFT_334130 [Daphnia pulex]